MVHRPNYAALKDVQIMRRREECALGTGLRSSSTNAQPMGAQIMQRKEERVRGMGQRTNYVAMKDAGIKLSTEECASSMGQRRGNCAAMKNAPTKHTKEECA